MPKQEEQRPQSSAYAGRWVARVQGRIVGQGGTPESAWRSAKAARPKEKPEISYMHDPSIVMLPEHFEAVVTAASGAETYLVGGAVRDMLLGRTSHDFDIVTRSGAIELARGVAGALRSDFYVLDEEFDAARVIVTDEAGERDVLDFTSFRGADILADLRARDFTINAIALRISDRATLDPLQGAADLRARTLRACSETAMRDDPVRIMRGVRLAAALGMKMEAGTREAMKAAAELLPRCSAERLRDEMFRIWDLSRADAAVRALEILGALKHMLPELVELKGARQSEPHVHDVWEHTLAVMRNVAEMYDLVTGQRIENANGMHTSVFTLGIGRYRGQLQEHFGLRLNQDRSLRALLQMSALYHDAGKPRTSSSDDEGRIHFLRHEELGARIVEERSTNWNLSNHETARLVSIVRNHLRFFFLASRFEVEGELPSRRAIYRFFRDAGEAAPELVLLGLADVRGTRGNALTENAWSAWVEVARILLENLWERPAESVAPPRLVDGHDLMDELGLEPGPEVGELLEVIREAQAAGEAPTREDALKVAREQLARSHP